MFRGKAIDKAHMTACRVDLNVEQGMGGQNIKVVHRNNWIINSGDNGRGDLQTLECIIFNRILTVRVKQEGVYKK